MVMSQETIKGYQEYLQKWLGFSPFYQQELVSASY